jgi:pyruvate kinase
MHQHKRTKIICTIGPACNTPEKLTKMVKAGMNVARMNMSHGTHASHAELISMVRSVDHKLGVPITIIGDLQGPKIRVGTDIPSEGIKIAEGETYDIPVSHRTLYKDVKKGDRVLIEDGLMDGVCVGGSPTSLKVKINVGGTLYSRKGLNFPDSTLGVSALTEKDKIDAVFCMHQKVHWVAFSFVTCAADVKQLRGILKRAAAKGQELPGIIVKIEKHEAIKNFDSILAETDAVMVARGDLGVETPAEKVPLIQKHIIDKCRAVGKPVIVATQMLDSMIRNPRPTRAEVSDVANAVIDHTDAVMLSGESANGKFPVESVATMARIVHETEASPFDNVSIEEAETFVKKTEDAIGNAANLLSRTLDADAILVATMSGVTARQVSRFRPELPIIAATPSEFIRRKTNLSWAVIPIAVPRVKDIDELVTHAIAKTKHLGLLKKGDTAIILAGQPVGERVNFVEVKKI